MKPLVSASATGPPDTGMLEARGSIVVVGIELRPVLAFQLRTAGFDVSHHRGLSDAQSVLDHTIPSAIILGSLRGAARLDEVRALRRRERLAFVQIVLMADERGMSMGPAIDAGADDVFDAQSDSTEEIEEQATRILARIARAERLSTLAMQDPLTGLHNRRSMGVRVPAEIARATRTGTRLSVAILDLDEFKHLNDHFGHAAGDRALVAFSHAVLAEVRSYDVVCRFGGDEFVVLFPDCGSSGGDTALTQLQARKSWEVPGLPVVSFSAGLAEFPDEGRLWTTLFEIADLNARRAKASGGGRTVRSTQTTSGVFPADAHWPAEGVPRPSMHAHQPRRTSEFRSRT